MCGWRRSRRQTKFENFTSWILQRACFPVISYRHLNKWGIVSLDKTLTWSGWTNYWNLILNEFPNLLLSCKLLPITADHSAQLFPSPINPWPNREKKMKMGLSWFDLFLIPLPIERMSWKCRPLLIFVPLLSD